MLIILSMFAKIYFLLLIAKYFSKEITIFLNFGYFTQQKRVSITIIRCTSGTFFPVSSQQETLLQNFTFRPEEFNTTKRKLFTLLYTVIVRCIRLPVLSTVFPPDDFTGCNLIIVRNTRKSARKRSAPGVFHHKLFDRSY